MKIPFLVLLIFVGWQSASAQADSAAWTLVREVAPQVAIVIQKHSMGADMVEVTALQADFPAEAMGQKCRLLGTLTGDPVRGLSVYREQIGGANLVFTKAKFATSGIILRDKQELNLQAIARAFQAGSPAVTSLQITFVGEVPNAQTIRTHATAQVVVAGSFTTNPPALEYRVRVLATKTDDIVIPMRRQEASSLATEEKKVPTSRVNWLVITLITIGSLAAGVLVYLRMLASSGHKP